MSPFTRSASVLGSAEGRSRKLRGKARKLGKSDRRVSWRLSELKADKIGAPGIGLNQRNRTAIMPSGEIRRGTRVIGMVKGANSVRVLRSGRRLFPGSGERQVRRVKEDEDKSLHHSIKKYPHKCKENGATNDDRLKRKASESVVHSEAPRRVKRPRLAVKNVKKVKKGAQESDKVVVTGDQVAVVDKMFGIVYTRKRKSGSIVKLESFDNKMFGIQFSRRLARKKGAGCVVDVQTCVFVAVVQNSGSRAASLLTSIFRHINNGVGLCELAGFLFSQPLNGTFASNGIRFLKDAPCASNGICKFFDSSNSVPTFDLDFSVIPSWFMQIHLNWVLRLSRVPSNTSSEECDEMMSEDEEDQLFVSVKMPQVQLASESDVAENRPFLIPLFRPSRLTVKSTQPRNGHYSRGVRKSRSSRRRRARNPSLLGVQPSNGLMVTSSVGSRKKTRRPLSSVVSMYKLRNALPASCMTGGPKKVGLAVAGGNNCTTGKAGCSADLLVIESDRCYRVKGVNIDMESSDSKESVLLVKKDDETKLSFLPQQYMRPSAVNRATHNVLWSGNVNWKLEFPSRQDWSNFKELYKECLNLNVSPAPTVVKAIPVPGVREVQGYESNRSGVFSRPDAYISVTTDEVARALAKHSANYDMDSEDEGWLKACSPESVNAVRCSELLSEDTFELMIDVFEKASHCSSEEVIDEKAALSLAADLAGQEVAETVYSYWLKKRKQRRSALLRVFQKHQVKKPPVTAKLVLRKRRSFKRQGGQCGKGKQLGLLQAMAVEHDALEERNAMLKLEEANYSAKRSLELAIEKRRKAQLLMENASLLCYKATMALRIAEALSAFGSAEVATTEMFDVGSSNGGDDDK
ncbi:unnamed protein product [Linum tenue]|uniref:Enhancer of polycomb-like protein n=1 Tax=Linum tenue TaxID=586396 RepID=A0AAV0JMN2_9ROSI|nr:unnamed protein product [Linum tenue]